MAGRGPTPKHNAMRRNHQPREQLAGTAVEAPPLPRAVEYGPDTLRWWATWASSPQAEVFLPTDWERLAMLAPLVEQFWATGDKHLLAEIRLNEERLGATVRDRQSLRMTFKTPDPAEAETAEPDAQDAGITNLERYRQAYGGG